MMKNAFASCSVKTRNMTHAWTCKKKRMTNMMFALTPCTVRNANRRLKAQVAKDAEHDFRLNSVDSVNKMQDSELHRQSEKDREHDARLDALEKLCAELSQRVAALEEQLKK